MMVTKQTIRGLVLYSLGLTLAAISAVGAYAETLSPISIQCPCSFEPQNQTHGLAKFSIVFNDTVAQSGDINVELRLLNDLRFFYDTYSVISSVEIRSFPFSADPQAIQIPLPTYAFSNATSGFPGLVLTNSIDASVLDGAILGLTKVNPSADYGLSSLDEAPIMFLTSPEFIGATDSAEVSVASVYAPTLAGQSETVEVIISAGSPGEGFYKKGSAPLTLNYDAEGKAALELTVALDSALDSHLSQDAAATDLQMRLNRGDQQILVYRVGSLDSAAEAPALGADLSAPDTLKDSDQDGISDFNERLLGTDPTVQNSVETVPVEMVYTYGKTASDEYGDDLAARIELLHEAANAVFSASMVPVKLVEIQRINVGDDRNLTGDDILDQMEARTGLFETFDSQLDRRPDLIIHLGLEEVLDTGGIANLLGGRADGIIASASTFAMRLNVGAVGIDGSDELTLPHEVGHLMGLVHSKVQGNADGAFPWSRGHGVAGNFVTTMGYASAFDEAPVIGKFSAPSLKCGSEGRPCGIDRSDVSEGADAALTLQTTAYQIAAISNGYNPVLTIVGDNPATVVSEAQIEDLSATATDAEDGDLTSQIVTTLTSAPEGSEGFTHLHTYSVKDTDGNQQSVSRKINLIADSLDSDNDGVADSQDAFPNNPNETADSDGDGVGDNADAFPNDAAETLDSDGDGVGDNQDAFPNDATETVDSDDDGVGNNQDAFPNDGSETRDTDGDGFGNNTDLDDDGDGFTDLEEIAAGTDPLSSGSCPGCFNWDVDDDRETKALTDGLLVIRFLFGFSGEALTAGAVGTNADRQSATAIASYLEDSGSELDIDGDGAAKALTDGLLLIRSLFGFSGDSLIAGAVGEQATRKTASEISSYIENRRSDNNGAETGSGTDSGGGSDSGSGTDSGSDTGSGTGSGSGTDTGGAGSVTGTTNVTINAVYDRVPYCASSCTGLDYANTRQDPIRYALAEVLDATTGDVLKSGLRTSGSGQLSFDLNDNATFKVRVYAESTGDGSATWGLKVVDNGGSDAAATYPGYSLESGIISVSDLSGPVQIRATSGWTGSGYGKTRSAAPFAILDSMITASLYTLSGRSSLVFEPVDVYWSEKNTADTVGTSFYGGNYIMILGDANTDTDEYDESIIIHEWGHYFQSILSRDNSVGGSHSSGELLDFRVAFSEGWANAFSGLAGGIDRYQDTSGTNQGGGFSLPLENGFSEAQGAVKGWYSEDSVQSIVFDLFDSGPADDDQVTLPVTLMIDSLVDYLPSQSAATSIFTFGAGLIASSPSSKPSILEFFAAEDIAKGLNVIDNFGTDETNSGKQYRSQQGVDALVLPIYRQVSEALVAEDLCQDSIFDESGARNKLGIYSFARFEIPVTGTYSVRVTSTQSPTGAEPDPDFGLSSSKGVQGAEGAGQSPLVGEESYEFALDAGDHWLWISDYNNYGPNGKAGRYCQKLEITQ